MTEPMTEPVTDVVETTPTGHGLAGMIRRHPLSAFFAWFFTVGQAFAFAPVVLGARGTPVPVQPFILASTLVGLLLPAVLITRIVDGPAGARALWRSAFDLGVPAGWYVFALGGVPLLSFALTAAVLGLPVDTSPSAVGAALLAGLALQLVLTFGPNNWWEEVAWAGFVQARLQARHGAVRAALVAGPLFALQHVSLLAGNPVVVGVLLLAFLAVLAVPFRFLTGWLFNRTGSLFLVGLVHAIGNAAAGGSGFGAGMLPRLYPERSFAQLAHLLAFAVLGLGVLIGTRGRLGRTSLGPGDPSTVKGALSRSTVNTQGDDEPGAGSYSGPPWRRSRRS